VPYEPVVVTGASRGIGYAVACHLADLGYDVVAWARTAGDLDELRKVDGSGRIRTHRVDVGDAEEVRAGVDNVLAEAATVRGVVVNAGIGEWGEVGDLSASAWLQMFATNVTGAFYTLSYLRPLLRAHPRGQVVATVSDSARFAFTGRAGYCASKAALESLIETFRRENRAHGIRVTALYPGRVDTYFRGRRPGSRPAILQTEDIAAAVGHVFSLPGHIELREMSLNSIFSSYGPYEEHSIPKERTE